MLISLTANKTILFQGENGDLKNRGGLKVEINHISAAEGGKDSMPASDNFPDSSIGEGMDITIHGANGHVKSSHTDTQSLRSHNSLQKQQCSMGDTLALPGLDDKLKYSDMSIGIGMDLSIHGEGESGACKDSYEDNINSRWQTTDDCDKKKSGSMHQFDENVVALDKDYKKGDRSGDEVSYNEDEIKPNVAAVLHDPVDDVVVEDCCPGICYRVCPCCIGDPDSPFWQLWYRHRLQVSR